jgi:hypothetical protein
LLNRYTVKSRIEGSNPSVSASAACFGGGHPAFGTMKLLAHVIDGHEVQIRPASVERDWMEGTDQRYAYRCLPLNIANAFGWEILCNSGFSAVWSGGNTSESIVILADPGTTPPAISHFGHGVLTFHLPCLFRTEPGVNLMAQGPVNRPKDGIAGLSGVIETDWAPYSFTMNWIFSRPGVTIRFDKGEPYCHIFPVRCGELESAEPELRWLSDNPELKREHEAWTASRARFNTALKEPGSEAQAEKWQKLYYRGLGAEGLPTDMETHRARLRLKPFKPPGDRS